jgi:nucleotide-binding universal stress UspA family protein
MTLKQLLVPVDFSKNSLKAIDAALALARPAGGQITLLYVLEPIIVPYGETLPGDLPNDAERRYGVEAEMEKLRGSYALDAPLQTLIVDGTAWDAICDTAERKQSDLIIITSHGYTGLKRLFLGSTAERVVRHAKCPVLVLKSFTD